MGLFNMKPKEYVYSNLKFSNRLPIGTIITLNDISEIDKYNDNRVSSYINSFDERFKNDKFIIISYSIDSFVKHADEKNKLIQVDYLCALYPIGSLPEEDFYIRSENIKEVVFKGYDDEIRKEFISEIETILEGDDK